jgi:3-hydroxyisobutyrate dehydrogenase-like beta-hydroxyacid dehydrogenase
MAMGSRAIYCGPSGQGAAMKLVGNALISFMLGGLCESLAVAHKAGLSTELVLDVIRASGFASPYYDFKGKALRDADYSTHFGLDLLVKDQSLMLALAAAQGTPMPGLEALGTWFRAASEQGYGAEDNTAVFKAVQKAAGLLPAAPEPSGART